MSHRQGGLWLYYRCFLLVVLYPQYVLMQQGVDSLGEFTSGQIDAQLGSLAARRSTLVAGLTTVRGVPARFFIRSLVDTDLCVHRLNLTSPAVVAARAASGLPATSQEDVAEYGALRLVLMPCSISSTDIFLAEAVLGRFYQNSGNNYRQGFIKPFTDISVCMYGVNETYTDGHPVFRVTNTEFYAERRDAYANVGDSWDEDHMDWFDEYTFEYAPYLRYGYNASTMLTSGVFNSPNPLPTTMLDASGWGPFPTTWGPCMENPTLDSATPTDDPNSEGKLRHHSWTFVDVPKTASIAHLPPRFRRSAYAIMTLGPDRPQPDVSPLAGEIDAGDLSAMLGGGDKPYGTGYSSLVSNELCLTTEVVKPGAEARLAPCNPVAPKLQQAFQLVLVTKAQAAKAKREALQNRLYA